MDDDDDQGGSSRSSGYRAPVVPDRPSPRQTAAQATSGSPLADADTRERSASTQSMQAYMARSARMQQLQGSMAFPSTAVSGGDQQVGAGQGTSAIQPDTGD